MVIKTTWDWHGLAGRKFAWFVAALIAVAATIAITVAAVAANQAGGGTSGGTPAAHTSAPATPNCNRVKVGSYC